MSPSCRLVRLTLGEKQLAYNLETASDPYAHLPILNDLDGTSILGLWAIIDYLEGRHPERPLVPEEPDARAEALRLLDWTMTKFHDSVTKHIVFEKASRNQTGSLTQRPPSMDIVRGGRKALGTALKDLGMLSEERGYLAGHDPSLADFAIAAHLSALDYFGEVPWADYMAIAEWYMRIKSRPSFRPLLSDRLSGQPPVPHYAELDF